MKSTERRRELIPQVWWWTKTMVGDL